MGFITISSLHRILNSVLTQRDYKSPRVFVQCKIFSDENDQKVVNVLNGLSWTELNDSNVISELTRSTMKHHLSSPRLIFAVTKLIVYYYNGVLNSIQNDIAQDLRQLSFDSLDYIVHELTELQKQGQLPLLENYEISRDNLAQSVVACVLHCFYFENSRLHPLGNAYSKGNVIVLSDSGVDQKQFEKDFPKYRFKMNWDELATTADCKYCKCERCKHRCAQFDSNYNVERLLKLYLNLNVKAEQQDDDEIDREETLDFLDKITDTLSSEAKSKFIKTLIRTNLSTNDQIRYAVDLMLQDKKKTKYGEKED